MAFSFDSGGTTFNYVDNKKVSIGSDSTEIIVSLSSPYDNTITKVNSYTNMTQKYSSRLNGCAGSGYIYVFSKEKGQNASVTVTGFAVRILER